jgi:hypothetical protein
MHLTSDIAVKNDPQQQSRQPEMLGACHLKQCDKNKTLISASGEKEEN